jgi:hypothetical protein
MQSDLTLGDQALLALMDELDGILDCEDVVGPGPVDRSTRAARVVDLPEPVGPVTSTRPLVR